MRTSHSYAIAIALLSVATAASSGCGEDETNDTTTSSTSTSTTSSSGTGGSGGEGAGSTGGGGSSSSGTGGGGGGTGGSGPDACLTSETTHVLINEVRTGPMAAEFIEIWNSGSAAVDLTNYYLSDNSTYHGIAAGDPWNPPSGNPDTDFLAQFPPGTSIAAGELLVIEFGTDFEGTHSSCPDFTVRSGVSCGGNTIPQMVEPTNGGIGANTGYLISNQGEMAMLFCWSPGYLVHDVDYVNWDPDDDANTYVDKTNVTGYLPDTSMTIQNAVAAPLHAYNPNDTESIGRCDDTEDDETATGGNGLLGHDETSETFNTSFVIMTASPGVANTCN